MAAFVPDKSVPVPLRHVEEELGRQMRVLQGDGDTPLQRASMSNLVIFCDRRDHAEEVAGLVPEIVAVHPARVILVVGEAEPKGRGEGEKGRTGESEPALSPSPPLPISPSSSSVAASVLVRCLQTGRERQSYSEQVTLYASGAELRKLPFAVRALLIGDLPINLWWRSQQPPPLAGPLLYELSEHAQQIVYDSLSWLEPKRAVAATYSWLEQVEQGMPGGRWRVASDLNWRRLKFWRRLLTQALDDTVAPGAVASATELVVEHGPHAVVQAWELVSWLTSQLGWKVQGGKTHQGVEIGWQFRAPHGPVRVRIRRLAEGPAQVLMLRLQCRLGETNGAVVIRLEEERRLTVVQEGVPAAPRTINIQLQSPAEILGRQLSDRERDPVFTQSMAVAQELARSILD
jgi:glucose-6-phosphate dehydrogenase assembly protein OpcA